VWGLSLADECIRQAQVPHIVEDTLEALPSSACVSAWSLPSPLSPCAGGAQRHAWWGCALRNLTMHLHNLSPFTGQEHA